MMDDEKIRRCAPPGYLADPDGAAADRKIRACVRDGGEPAALDPDLKIRIAAGRDSLFQA